MEEKKDVLEEIIEAVDISKESTTTDHVIRFDGDKRPYLVANDDMSVVGLTTNLYGATYMTKEYAERVFDLFKDSSLQKIFGGYKAVQIEKINPNPALLTLLDIQAILEDERLTKSESFNLIAETVRGCLTDNDI